LLSAWLALGFTAGCTANPPVLGAPARTPPAAGELRVELVFGAGADLDLYVTDPAQETVYFANTPSRASGGRLEADLRCQAGTGAPRVETVVFASAPTGRYRVGVDYAAACEAGGDAAEAFLVVVEFGGLRRGEPRREVRGEISRGSFLPQVLELDLPAGER